MAADFEWASSVTMASGERDGRLSMSELGAREQGVSTPRRGPPPYTPSGGAHGRPPSRHGATAASGLGPTTAGGGRYSGVGAANHQEKSLQLIRNCLASVDTLYSNIQSFNPGAAASVAARKARQQSGDRNQEVERLQDQVDALRRELDEVSSADTRALMARTQSLEADLAEASRTGDAATRDLAEAQSDVAKLSAKLEAETQRSRRLEERHEGHLDKIAALQAKLERALDGEETQAEVRDLLRRVADAEARAQRDREAREAAEHDLRRKQQEYDSLQEQQSESMADTKRFADAERVTLERRVEDLQRQLSNAAASAGDDDGEVEALQDDIERLQARVEELEVAETDVRAQLRKAREETEDEKRQSARAESMAQARLEAMDQLEEQVASLTADVQRLRDENASLSRQLRDAQQKQQRATSSSDDDNAAVADLQDTVKDLEAKLEEAESDHVQSQRMLSDMVKELQDKLDAQVQVTETCQSELSAAQSMADDAAASNRELTKELNAAKQEAHDARVDLAEAKTQVQHLTARLQGAEARAAESNELQEQLDDEREALQLAKAKVAKLEHDVESMRVELKSSRAGKHRLAPVTGSVTSPGSPGAAAAAAAAPAPASSPAPAPVSPATTSPSPSSSLQRSSVFGAALGPRRTLPPVSGPASAALPPVKSRSPLQPTPTSGNLGGFAPDVPRGTRTPASSVPTAAPSPAGASTNSWDDDDDDANSWDDDDDDDEDKDKAPAAPEPAPTPAPAPAAAAAAAATPASLGGRSLGGGPSPAISQSIRDALGSDTESDGDEPQFYPATTASTATSATTDVSSRIHAALLGLPDDSSDEDDAAAVGGSGGGALQSSFDEGGSEASGPGRIGTWTQADVQDWLAKDCSMPHLVGVFRTHGVTGERLLTLTASDLSAWGLAQRDVKRLCSMLELAKEVDEEEEGNVADWTVAEVQAWLEEELRMRHLAATFREHDVDGARLLTLQQDDLEAWGVPSGDAGAVMDALDQLQEAESDEFDDD